jgi:hypothetical protein
MANLFDIDDEQTAGTVPGLFDGMDGRDATEADELTDAEEFALVARFVRDCMDAPPDRVLINGQLFMWSGDEAIYTNIEDPDDDRIFEIDPETGELCQWPDGD